MSKGEYIFFVDSDDYLPLDAIELLVAEAIITIEGKTAASSADPAGILIPVLFQKSGKKTKGSRCI